MAHSLRIKGRGTPRALADALALDVGTVDVALADLDERGWATDSGNPVLGWSITPAGRAAVQSSVDALPELVRELVAEQYRIFQRLNRAFKQLCVDWQLRDTASVSRQQVSARLAELDAEMHELLAKASDAIAHFGSYAGRLSSAIARFEAGSDEFLTGVRVDSYHQVWFECHEDFLLVLHLSRAEEERHDGYR